MNRRHTAPQFAERGSSGARTPGRILVADHDGMYLIKFVGDVRVEPVRRGDDFLAEMFRDEDFKSVLVDLTATQGIDSTSLGILAKLSIKAFGPVWIHADPGIDERRYHARAANGGFRRRVPYRRQTPGGGGAIAGVAAWRDIGRRPAPTRTGGASGVDGIERVQPGEVPGSRRHVGGG